MSDTPRTDAAPKAEYRDAMFCELVSADFARQLERELTEKQSALEIVAGAFTEVQAKRYELLAALKTALTWMETHKRFNAVNDSGPLSQDIAKVRAAIAKAQDTP